MRLKLGRLLGTDVYLHWTFFFVPAVLIYIWRYQMGWEWLEVGAAGGLVAIAYSCILMHEYGHVLAARRLGIDTRDIIITPVGGLARLECLPRSSFHELYVTLAGPAVNLVLACILFLTGTYLQIDLVPPDDAPMAQQALPMVLWLNVALFLFNLLPAFPMDGGRILRSVFAFWFSYSFATRCAVLIGQLMAVLFIAGGVYFSQWSTCIIGAFVFFAASRELRQFEQAEEMKRQYLAAVAGTESADFAKNQQHPVNAAS